MAGSIAGAIGRKEAYAQFDKRVATYTNKDYIMSQYEHFANDSELRMSLMPYLKIVVAQFAHARAFAYVLNKSYSSEAVWGAKQHTPYTRSRVLFRIETRPLCAQRLPPPSLQAAHRLKGASDKEVACKQSTRVRTML